MTDEPQRNLTMPGNPRYQPITLQPFFGYDNAYRGVIEVEIAALEVMIDIGLIPPDVARHLDDGVRARLHSIRATDVDRVERKVTKHDIRALILVSKDYMPLELWQWFHRFMTSYDPLDTGRILMFLRAHREVIRPAYRKVLADLTALVRTYADTLQIGRTHGRHAIPITVGFWLATVLYRVHFNILNLERASEALMGKISGAVGAYNAQVGLGVLEKCGHSDFEERVLTKLGLPRSPISTQILPPEALAYYLHACVMTGGSLAQLGQDCRNLMRSEIDEIGEPFSANQSGSSAMPHKRNPINWENIVGTHLKNVAEYGKVFSTLTSDHQRDLTGSTVARDFPVIVINLFLQLNTLNRPDESERSFLSRMKIDTDACWRNFDASKNLILGEPLYGAVQMAGYRGDAHQLVNHVLVERAVRNNQLLADEAILYAREDPDFAEAWERIPVEIRDLLRMPDKYTGLASQKAVQIAEMVETYLAETDTTRFITD